MVAGRRSFSRQMGAIGISGGLFSLCLVASLAVAWWVLSLVDFGYPVWYRVLDIEQTVSDHAPLNQHRPGFQATTPADHERLFGEMLAAVNRGGSGLEAIEYVPAGTSEPRPLLRPAEVTHLQDVASLVRLLHWAGGLALCLLPVALVLARRRRFRPVPARWLLAGMAGLVTVSAAVVAVIGPVTVFYAAHDWIFPADHQWFFYYDESLMTMLMQAPNLFLPLGLSWIGLALALFAVVWFVLNRLLGVGTVPSSSSA